MVGKPVSEVIETLEKARIPCGKVYTITEVVSDPHIKARQMFVDLTHADVGSVPLPGVVAKLSETPGEIRTPAPVVGEHNDEIYQGLIGLGMEEVARLRSEGII